MSANRFSRPFEVVIAGGGVAALEALMALRAAAGTRAAITLVSASDELEYRPLTVLEPFAAAAARRYRVAPIAADLGAELVIDSLQWVDAEAQRVHLAGETALNYDALLVAVGARPYPAFEHAVTIDDRILDDQLHGVLEDVEQGYCKRIAFVVPPRVAWPLPLYELALMTARRAYEVSSDPQLTLITPEESALAIFGPEASGLVRDMLTEAGVGLMTSTEAEVPAQGVVKMPATGETIKVDRVVALPLLMGPAVRGLPAAEHAFIPIDSFCAVAGVRHVFAAGDATDFPVKHGSIAAQQADVAADAIAALIGVSSDPQPFRPVLRARLLTGGSPRYLTAILAGATPLSSEVSETSPWDPPSKMVAARLAHYLDKLDPVEAVT
jgi:sulfide:quinone oxidoreductase